MRHACFTILDHNFTVSTPHRVLRVGAPCFPMSCAMRRFLHVSHHRLYSGLGRNSPRKALSPSTTAIPQRQSFSSRWLNPLFNALPESVGTAVGPSQSPSNAASAAATAASTPYHNGDDRQLKGARKESRTDAADIDDQRRPTAATEYKFPTGRALHYVRYGRRLHSRQAEEREELREWLAELHEKTCHLRRDGERKGAEPLNNQASDSNVTPAPSSNLGGEEEEEEEAQGAASSFIRYHAHHVVVEFKKLRRTLTKRQQHRKQHAAAKGFSSSRGDRRGPGTGGNTGGDEYSPSLSWQETDALVHFLFAATVLLHLGGLYTVADTHVEPLLEVCFSITIFLSQNATATGRLESSLRRTGKGFYRLPKDQGEHHATPPSEAQRLAHQRYLHSLHWSIVHFAAAVQSWGLLEHTSPLQDTRKTQLPYQRLLQVHAALLCELARKHIDHVVWHELILLKSGPKAPASQAAWFLGSDADAYSRFFDRTATESTREVVPVRLQQRRLQLLPLLWLSLLSSQLALQEGYDCATSRQDFSFTTSENWKVYSTNKAVATDDAVGEVGWGSARHAFASLLPLFAREARFDVTSWVLLHILYRPPRGSEGSTQHANQVAGDASLTETCAFLARIEESGAALELGAVLPLATSEGHGATRWSPHESHSSSQTVTTASDARRRAGVHLTHFLRRYVDTADVRRQVRDESGNAASGSVLSQKVHASRTVIHRPVQLYRALLNIPLCTLQLPPPRHEPETIAARSNQKQGAAPTPASLALPMTVDGVRLVNALLLRILVQWRRGPGSRHTSSSTETAASSYANGQNERGAHLLKDENGGARRIAGPAPMEWEGEMFCVLQAVHHLHLLLSEAMASEGMNGPQATTILKGNAEATLQLALLVPTVQAAARAVAEQLGTSILPCRRVSDGGRHRQPLSDTERQLLLTLDAELRRVLMYRLSACSDSTGEPGAGGLPWSYRVAFSALVE